MRIIKINNGLPILFSLLFWSSTYSQVVTNIVLVDAKDLNRKEFIKAIDEINSTGPKVIAIDIQFSARTIYSEDLALINALRKCKNLVMCSVIDFEDYAGKDDNYEFTYGCLPQFVPPKAKTGFINLILETDEHSTLKRFVVWEKVENKIEYNFSVQTAINFDSTKAFNFINNSSKIREVNYEKGLKFKVIQANDILKKRIHKNEIENKIILVGYLGPLDLDKYYSPMAAKSEPDIYGLEYHAIILNQILNN